MGLLIAFVCWLLLVLLSDWRHRRVPNTLVVGGASIGLIGLALGMSPFGLQWQAALMGALIGFAGLLVFYALKLMGAADVKFAAALGLWVGLVPLAWVWVGASILAALHALGLLLWRKHTGQASPRQREIPYAAHMAAVTLGGLLWRHLTH